MSKREEIFNNNIGLVHRVINSNYSWTKVSQYKDDVFNEITKHRADKI